MFLKSSSLKGTRRCPFKQVDMVRDLIVSGAAYDPGDNSRPGTYTIPAGTPVAPVSGGHYLPVRRTRIATGSNNAKTLAVQSSVPFRAGDAVALYSAISGTADFRTVDSITSGTTTEIVLTDVATVAAGDRIEVRANGAHGNTTAAVSTEQLKLQDAVLLLNDVCVYHASDGSTFDTPAVGVVRGQIAVSDVNGPGTTSFDTDLEYQVPGLDFVPLTPGSG